MGQPAHKVVYESPAEVPNGRPQASPQRRLRFSLGRFTLIVLLGYFLIMFATQQVQIMRLRSEVLELEQQVAMAVEGNARLEDRLEYLASDDYIEILARRELGLIREGEIVISNIGGTVLSAGRTGWR